MRFENVAMQSNNCKNATTLRNIFTDSLITAVVKATLRKNNSISFVFWNINSLWIEDNNIFRLDSR